MPHPAMLELCEVLGFAGMPPETLSSESILAILEWHLADIDPDGILWFLEGDRDLTIPLKHGLLLRSLIGPDG